ncbi:hypothetical protein SAMN05192573_108121 [Mucilaginibacter gossypii]|uniref:Uncharacterized protein n=1 Tax=Mucilaginibacter gossypii TaxID=551996 RepID=A0A1G8B7E4_9SPHI|nr:hypothetical protein SAMN05192573_108121 [Mucilaginibacter gossypii]
MQYTKLLYRNIDEFEKFFENSRRYHNRLGLMNAIMQEFVDPS